MCFYVRINVFTGHLVATQRKNRFLKTQDGNLVWNLFLFLFCFCLFVFCDRRKIGALTLFHRMYYGEAPELLCQLLPEHLQLDPRLRRSVRSHDLAVQIPRSNLVSHKRSFVPSAARIWNSLPEYIPSLEKRVCFKKEVNRYLGDN